MYVFGSIPILYYTPSAGGAVPPPGNEHLLLTNLSSLLLTDLTNLDLAGA